jgi:selenide, water dikinase
MVRLTSTVKKGGCAAKVAAVELRKILSRVRFPPSPADLLVDGRHFDDAAIFKISPSCALVQTLDFFTPIVDSAQLFGQIAAANALSDVYAMGGRPQTCMAILAAPMSILENETISEVLQGASDVISAAGACLVGGHSIDDETLKFGLSVTGTVHPDKIWANTGSRVGDTLILTKPLGTGTLTAGLKREAYNESQIDDALQSMAQINNVIDDLPQNLQDAVHAATDITGFGLSGHGVQMAQASQVTFEINVAALPTFANVQTSLQREFLTKAHRTNREYAGEFLETRGLAGWQELLLHDPQTSGGLLLSVNSADAETIVAAIRSRFSGACAIGQVLSPGAKPVVCIA